MHWLCDLSVTGLLLLRNEKAGSSSLAKVLCPGLLGGLRGKTFDLLQAVGRRNKKMLRMLNNKLLLASFRILRYNTVLDKF